MAAQKFGCRPSDLVVIRDPVLALDFDLAATARLLDTERRSVAEDSMGPDDATPAPGGAREIHW
jgi:hypothetical protein